MSALPSSASTFFFFQAEDGIRDLTVTGVQTCALPILQYAGLAALTGSQEPVARMVAGLKVKRDQLVRGLNAVDGVTCATPAGAVFCFPHLGGVPQRPGPPLGAFAQPPPPGPALAGAAG